MEYGSLSLAEVSPAIAGAFVSMASNVPGMAMRRDPDWGLQCEAPLRHPIANFAWVENIEAWQEKDLPIMVGQSFNVYVPWQDEDGPYVPGFRHALTQRTMIAEPKRRPYEARHRVDEAKTNQERRRVADFMVTLFYHSTPRDTRQIITKSIEMATDLRLYWISNGSGGVAGACALYDGHDIWGIYNVMVDEDMRSSGRGRALIAEMLGMGYQSGRLIQLQCNSNLIDWYASMGFREHSRLHIYCV